MRSVAGMSHLSTFCNPRHKNLSSLESFAVMLKPRDRMLSLYLKGGYHHLIFHPGLRKYFVERFGNRYVQYIALPFG